MDMTGFMELIITGIIAIGMALVGYIVSVLVVRLVRPLANRLLEPGLASFAVSIARAAVLLLTLKLIVDQTGAAGVLVILVTAITGAFALGSERIASDVVAGVNLFLLHYYHVGDLVTIGEHHGQINAISLTHTSLRTNNRDQIIIPNSEVLGQVIVNHTGIVGARLAADIPIEGLHNRQQTMTMLLEIANTFEPQLRGPGNKPTVALKEVSIGRGTHLSIYTVRVIVPEQSYGEDEKLFLHMICAIETYNTEVSEVPASIAA